MFKHLLDSVIYAVLTTGTFGWLWPAKLKQIAAALVFIMIPGRQEVHEVQISKSNMLVIFKIERNARRQHARRAGSHCDQQQIELPSGG